MHAIVGYVDDAGGHEALALAALLGRSGDIGLTVSTVLPAGWDHPSPARVDAEYRAWLAEQARDWGRSAVERLAAAGVPGATAVQVAGASVPAGLVALARERGASLVVLGSARPGGGARFTAGSVTGGLLHSSPVPLALAPEGFAVAAGRVRRVTCGFVDPARCAEALAAAVRLAARWDAALRVATFVPRRPPMFPPETGLDAERMVAAERREEAGALLRDALAALPAEIPPDAVTSAVAEGEGWAEALDALPWDDGDLLVVGSSRRGPLASVFLGSTATKILRHTPVPVVVVPRGARPLAAATGQDDRQDDERAVSPPA